MTRIPPSILGLVIAITTRLALAQSPSPRSPNKVPAVLLPVDQEKVPVSARPDATELWSHFSAGFLLSCLSDDIISSAEVRDGTVRVLRRTRFIAGVGLQAYYALWGWTTLRSSDLLPLNDPNKEWSKYSETGFGPYLGVSLASSDIIDTIGFGVAFSARRQEGGIRIGLGVVFDPDAQRLAADYKENTRAPANAVGVKYVEEVATGGQLMVTFTPGFGD